MAERNRQTSWICCPPGAVFRVAPNEHVSALIAARLYAARLRRPMLYGRARPGMFPSLPQGGSRVQTAAGAPEMGSPAHRGTPIRRTSMIAEKNDPFQ